MPNVEKKKQQICWIENILENISFLKSDIGNIASLNSLYIYLKLSEILIYRYI